LLLAIDERHSRLEDDQAMNDSGKQQPRGEPDRNVNKLIWRDHGNPITPNYASPEDNNNGSSQSRPGDQTVSSQATISASERLTPRELRLRREKIMAEITKCIICYGRVGERLTKLSRAVCAPEITMLMLLIHRSLLVRLRQDVTDQDARSHV
jgi:hypothetical protein